ncbi:MAG TPA: hypothetical protein VJL54_06260 [Nitrososphaera sp.]|nr:hypothetical protein [Nitrososphaera sp.]
MSQVTLSSSTDDSKQVLDCPCLECKHEFLADCITNSCNCCDLEDAYFLLTGDEVRDM